MDPAEEEPSIEVRPADGWLLADGPDIGAHGIPACKMVLAVSVRITMNAPNTLHNFCNMLRMLPVSITMELLRPNSGVIAAVPVGGKLTAAECEVIVNGHSLGLMRPMLCDGDQLWSLRTQESIHALPSEHDKDRLREFVSFLQMGCDLTYSRAMGSDTYTNDRVAAIGVNMASRNRSASACISVYNEAKPRLAGACGMLDAMNYTLHKLDALNTTEWRFRPGNMQNFLHCITSDVMMCLNYHGGCMQGAENGIGSTLMWSDGGNNQRTLSKVPSHGWVLETVRRKNRGNGADFVINSLIIALSHKNYDPESTLGEIFIELKQTSQQGLLMDVCNMFEEKPGLSKTIAHLVKDCFQLLYTTELQAQNNSVALACLQALSWLIYRNTITKVQNTLRTTRADDATGRVKVTYVQVKGGFLAIASNNVGKGPVDERIAAINSVVRRLSSCTAAMDNQATGYASDTHRANLNGRQNYMARPYVQPSDLIAAKKVHTYALTKS